MSAPASSAPQWTKVTNFAPGGAGTMMLLTDGTIMIQQGGSQNWMRLTPNSQGSYINGAWSSIAPMSTPRLYYASAVLPDGRVWVLGGEYTGPGLVANRSGTAEIYDPLSNTWTAAKSYPPTSACPSVSQFGGMTTSGSPIVSSILSTADWQPGWGVTGSGIPASTTIASVDSATQIHLSQNASFTTTTVMSLTVPTSGDTTAGSNIVTGIPSTTGFQVGFGVSGSGIQTSTSITSIDSPTQIHISRNALATGSSVSLTLNVVIRPPTCFGDVPSMLLPSGKILAGSLNSGLSYIYDPATDTWSSSISKVYNDPSNEGTWARMSDGRILTYDIFQSVNTGNGYAERFDPNTNTWSSISPVAGTAGGTLPLLSSSSIGYEFGGILRLYDGRMFVIGANGHTALYNPSTNSWAAGPDTYGELGGVPFLLSADDAPAAILPNGHVILSADSGLGLASSGTTTLGSTIITDIPSTAQLQIGWAVSGPGIPSGAIVSSVDSDSQIHISAAATANATGVSIKFAGIFSRPTQILDFDPVEGTINAVSPSLQGANLNNIPAYVTRMLMLPNGQLLFSDASSQLWIYTSDSEASPELRPVISSVTSNGAGVFTLAGTQLTGQSQGASYGDDVENDEDYPIVRLVGANGNVYYARTTNWSPIGVATGSTPQTVNFTLSGSVPVGVYSLIVSAAGISSDPVAFTLGADLKITKQHTGNFAQGQTGATYTISVSNIGSQATSGTVTVSDALPAGLSATSISGTNWTCGQPAGPCTQTNSLPAGSLYPDLTLVVNVSSTTPSTVTNNVTVSGGGDVNSANNTAADPTTVSQILASPVLISPANASSGISTTPSLIWNPVIGALSYDVYLGTSSSPPFLANTTATAYSVPGLSSGNLYFWRVVAKNALFSTTSAAFSFTSGAVRRVPGDYSTIQGAIDAAQNGDIVRVAPGTYVENINFLGKAITVVSEAGPDVTTIDGSQAGSAVLFSSSEAATSVLEGFTIRNGKGPSNQGGGIRIANSSPTIRRNRIVNNVGCSGIGIAVSFGSPLIQGNLIRDNKAAGCSGGTGGGGILLSGSASAQILDNTISNNASNEGGGLSLFSAGTPLIRGNTIIGNSADSGGGIVLRNTSDATIVQNVIAGNKAQIGGGINWLVSQGTRGPSVTNNTIVDNDAFQQGSGIFADGFDGLTTVKNNLIVGKTGQAAIVCGTSNNASTPIFTFNDVFASQAPAYGGRCSDVTGTNGNISAAPLFVDRPGGNFRLVAGSPGIDAADKNFLDVPLLDLDSIPRVLPIGGALDMGAYEFAAPTTSTISPLTLTFADQGVGTLSSPSDVTLTNTGTQVLVVSNVVVTGEFSQTNTCQTSSGVAPGESCTISLRFAPILGGSRSGQLTVAGNGGAVGPVLLSGNGLGPLTLSTTAVSFPDQRVGTTGTATAVTVSNAGPGILNISAITTTGDFTNSTDCPASLSAGTACTINVRFAPTARGSRSGAVNISSGATGSPHFVLLSGRGLAPAISFDPTSLQFDNQAVGSASPAKSVTVSNQGDIDLSINSISITGEFARTHDCGATLGVNQSCTISAVFNPTTIGARTGVIAVADDAIGSPHTVGLAGTGLGALLSASAASLDFGNQVTNVTSAPKTVTLLNTGNASLTPSISTSGDFARSTDCLALAPSASCNVTVTFRPTAPGPRTGSMTITSASIGGPVTLPLSGVGVEVVFFPGILDFGDVRIAASKTLSTTFTNNSPTAVSIQNISVSPGFTRQSNCGVSLAPGAGCNIDVTFVPGAAGTVSGTLSVTSDAGGSPHTISLTGRGGVGNVSLSSSSLQFGTSLIGSASLPQSVSLTNSGTAPLTFSSISTSGDFSQTNTCGTTLSTGLSCQITLIFLPAAEGARSGSLSVVSDGTGTDSVALQGTGLSSFPAPFITGLSPDNRVVGGADFTLTVNGSGFFSQSTIRWGGVDRATTFVSNTTLSASISSADLATMATIPVSVFNPAPGGGLSNSVGFVLFLPTTLSTKDLAYDRLGGRISASVPATAPSRPNTVTPIDPVTGVIGNSVFIGSDPGKLAISTDSRSIYVSLDGAAQVRRFDTVSQTAGAAINLGSDPFYGPYYAEDIAVSPASADTIAVSRKILGISPRHAGVAIYDNGIKRSVETPRSSISNVIEFSDSSSTLYGYNNETSEFGLRTMAVSSSGVTTTNVQSNLVSGFGVDIQFEGGRIYTTTGRVIDPISRTLLGAFPLPTGGEVRGVVADSALKRVFILYVSPSSVQILAFNSNTFTLTGSVALPPQGLSSTLGSLIRWGKNGLAFRTATQVFTLQIPENWLSPRAVRDFNGDGRSDILWRDSAGKVSIWQINGSAIASDNPVANIGTNWTISGSGDFNGDGKADILWREVGGDVVVWLMDGATISSYATIANIPTSWNIAGVADFSGDGKADILWRSGSGEVAIWIMNGATLSNFASLGTVWTGWTIAGTGDFDGDGKDDILWRSVSGDVAMWLMNGTDLSNAASLGNIWTGWTIVGTGDFDGDGRTDILWRSDSGDVVIWLMDGFTVTSGTLVGNVWPGWKIVQMGDYNADGKSDILWQDAGGNVVVWFMNAATLSGYAEMGNVSDRRAQ